MKLFHQFRLAAVAAATLFGAKSTLAAPQPFSIAAKGGPIRITPIFHASLQIEYRGKVIQVDPFSKGNYSHAKKADIILITHTHPDHLDRAAIRNISGGFPHIIGPQSVINVLKPGLHGQPHKALADKGGSTIPLGNGQAFDFHTKGRRAQNVFILIQAVPMYNMVRGPKPGQKFHPKGEFNGYILTLGGKRIYIAGDTEATPEMKKLKNIDVAFLPMNLPFTMTPQEAAAAARAFKPKIAVPYHYRYPFDKPNTNPQQFAQSLRGSGIKVLLLDWYSK